MTTNETEQKRQVAKVKLLETFSLGKNTEKNSGVEITVFGKDGKPQLGTIIIGAGSLKWRAKKAKKLLYFTWYEFATLMYDEQKRRREKERNC